MNDNANKPIQSHCNNCGGVRNHFLLHKEEVLDKEEVDEYSSFEYWDCYEVLKCCGCDKISMRHRSSFSEDRDEFGQEIINTTYYPPSMSRRKPRWMDDISFSLNFGIDNIKEILDEVYICLQNDAPRLAVMGVRSLVEHIILEKIEDKGTFYENVTEFARAGFISDIQKDIIKRALDAGSAVTHRGFKPDKWLVADVVDIAESLVEMLYVNPSRSRRIEKKTPPRKK